MITLTNAGYVVLVGLSVLGGYIMIELTNAAYWTLVALSAIGGYILHGVVDAIKKGEFFD